MHLLHSPLGFAVVGLAATAQAVKLADDNAQQQQQRLLVVPSQQQPLTADEAARAAAHVDKLPLVSSADLEDTITAGNLMARARAMFDIAKESFDEYNHPTRVIGSQGHASTIEYILSTLNNITVSSSSSSSPSPFYSISTQPFPAVAGSIFESRLVLGNSVPKSAYPFSLTPPTKNKQPVFAPLVLADNEGCSADDFPAAVNGSVAFVKRGVCPFGDKSANAGAAGAVAVVVFNNEPSPVAGTLGFPDPNHVATFGLSGAEAAPFLAALAKGDKVDAIAYIDSVVGSIETTNVLAQTVGGDPDNCVMLGAHSDSVAEGPGINDDGSGTMSLLEVATQLAKFKVNNCVRFAWWAGEEEGLLGSDYYVGKLPADENLKVRLFMDYDMLASPNFAYQVYDARDEVNPKGSQALRDLYTAWYEGQGDKGGLNWTYIPFDGRSDYDGFIRAGIPAGGIATGAEGVKTKEEETMFGGWAGKWYDPCYHQLCDGVGNLNVTAWVLNTKLVAHSVATYAVSFQGFPKREALVTTKGQSEYEKTVKYHGHKLFI